MNRPWTGEEMNSAIDANWNSGKNGKNEMNAKSDRIGNDDEHLPSARRQDSWVDAIVTVLATIVFGLGWALVELERADLPLSRYDTATSEIGVAAIATSIETRADGARATEFRTVRLARSGRHHGDKDARWTVPALQRSKR